MRSPVLIRGLMTACTLALAAATLPAAAFIGNFRGPKVDGELALPGLSAPVRVLRDEHGIPYIFAANTPDLIRAQGGAQVDVPLDAYAIVADMSSLPLVLQTLQALRLAGVSVMMHASANGGMGSLKSQFKRADSSGARYALVFGVDEVATGRVAIKPLRDNAGEQVSRTLSDLANWAPTLQSCL